MALNIVDNIVKRLGNIDVSNANPVKLVGGLLRALDSFVGDAKPAGKKAASTGFIGSARFNNRAGDVLKARADNLATGIANVIECLWKPGTDNKAACVLTGLLRTVARNGGK